jgi:hypothetical protein
MEQKDLKKIHSLILDLQEEIGKDPSLISLQNSDKVDIIESLLYLDIHLSEISDLIDQYFVERDFEGSLGDEDFQ